MPLRSKPPGKPLPPHGVPGSVFLLVCTLASPWALATSCASHAAKPAPTPSATPAVAVESRVGVVRAVGAGQRFVLIETPSASATASLAEGQLLHCRPPGAERSVATADLRVSRERQQSLVVANVVAGEPEVGAVVYSAPEQTPPATPDPGSISSLSTAPLPNLFPPRKP